jgi:hypothetical protein
VHDLYFEPKYEEFEPRTIWSLSNAFTSAFKELDPIPQFRATAKLGEFLEPLLAGLLRKHGSAGRAADPFKVVNSLTFRFPVISCFAISRASAIVFDSFVWAYNL